MTALRNISLWAALVALSLAGCEEKKNDKPVGPVPTTGTAPANAGSAQPIKLSVASYDPTRELYVDLNPAFEQWYKARTGRDVKVETDHGPSGKQGLDIAAGKPSDVAALSVEVDIDTIAKSGAIGANWRDRLPNKSVPYSSAVVFLVRKGNPKQIKDWEDLARDGVEVLAPDPKTGGGARWIYLSTWCHALRKATAAGKSPAEAEASARAFTKKVYAKAITDPAMRSSSTRFIQQGGDVLFGWENEIFQIIHDPRTAGQFELVVPSDSIEIEVPIAIVDKVVDAKGSREAAEAYVNFHFEPQGQEIIARRYNRVINKEVAAKFADKLRPLTLYKFSEYFKDWASVMSVHFNQGGELDKMRGK